MENLSERLRIKIKKLPELFEKTLSIPAYQRPYKWQDKNVLQLLNDISENEVANKSAYRIGTIILHNDQHQLSIVDGQQRLVTMSLILFYLDDLSSPLLKTNFSHIDSKDNIKNNYEIIREWFEQYNNQQKAAYLNYILNCCEFVAIELDDISEAFQLFDSQNARGKTLEPYDLLKAFHLREMKSNTQEERKRCAEQWQNAVDKGYLEYLGKYIYRIRKWARHEDAGHFTKDNIEDFKGINLSSNRDYPYLKPILLNDAIVNQLNSGLLDQIGSKNDNFPFQLTQVTINGKRFFEFVAYYSELFSKHFRNNESALFNFYKKGCFYPGSHRNGDTYVREMFEAAVLLYLDKYGEAEFDKNYLRLYKWSYLLRLKQSRVMYASIDKYIRESVCNIFKSIDRSYHPKDIIFTLPKLEGKDMYPITEIKEIFNQ